MAQSQLDSVKNIYDSRSKQYDENQVHLAQAKDYISWAALQKGESVLDLACGTGLVALLAKREVGDTGHVVGVDISEGMLNVARRKADAEGLNVPFLNHDITDLSNIRNEILPKGNDGFDVITCASALILLPDPAKAVDHWKSLLRPGGRLLTDVQTKDANLVIKIFSGIANELGESVPWHSHHWQSQQALEDLVVKAELKVQKTFETEGYAKAHYDAKEAPELFDKAVEKVMFENFGRAEIRMMAKEMFVQRFVEIADSDGSVEEETKFWVVVATNES